MKVYVVGSTNQDIVVQLDKRPNIGETVLGNTLHYFQGGKGANQAIACHNMGGSTVFVSMVGNDAFGSSLKEEIQRTGLHCRIHETHHSPTGTAIIAVDKHGENTIVVIAGANNALSIQDAEVALQDARAKDLLLIQNELNKNMLVQLLVLGRKKGLTTIVNAAPHVELTAHLDKIDYLIVNEHELELSLKTSKIDIENLDLAKNQIREIAKQTGLNLIVTLGEKGVLAYIEGIAYDLPGNRVNVVDTTGAGDCFCGAFVGCLSSNTPTEQALRYANIAASLSVQLLGASSSYPSIDSVVKTSPCPNR